MSSDSSCPDLTQYTWNVVHSVSAEACKKFPNNYGKTLFIQNDKKSADIMFIEFITQTNLIG